MKKHIIPVIISVLATINIQAQVAELQPAQNQKGKYGYTDSTGVFIVKPAYDMATPYIDGISRVRKGSKWGLVDAQGKPMTSVKYAYIGDYNNYGLALVNVGGTSEYAETMMGAVTGGKYGYINRKGEEVLPPKYTDIGFFDSTNTAWVQAGNKYGLIDTTGRLVAPAKYVAHGEFGDNNICWVNVGGGKNAQGEVIGGRYGYIARNGQEVIPPAYVAIRKEFHNGTAWVTKGRGKAGYIDNTGKEIVAPVYDDVADTFSMDKSYVKKRNLWGFINRNGQAVTEIKYNSVYPFHGGMAAVGIRDGKSILFGYIDETGREVVPPIYESVAVYCNDLHGFVKKGGKWAYIDKNGKPLTDFNITGFSVIMDGGYVTISFDSSFNASSPTYNNVLDTQGRQLNKNIYKNVWALNQGYFCVNKQDGTWCWLDTNGNECFDNGYTAVGSFSEGLAYARKGGENIYINLSGEKAFSIPGTSNVSGMMFNNGVAYITNGEEQWGCIDNTGKVIIPLGLATQADVDTLLKKYKETKEPLKSRDIELYNLYKNTVKCSIYDRLGENMWGY